MEWEQLKCEIESVVGKRLDELQTNLEFQRSRLVDVITNVKSFAELLKQKGPSEVVKPAEEPTPQLSRAQTTRTHHKTELIKTAPIDVKKIGLKKPGLDDPKKEEAKAKSEEAKIKLEEAKKKKAEEAKKKKEEEETKKKDLMLKKKEEEDRKKEEAKKKVEEAKEKKKQEDLDKKAKAEEAKKKAEEVKEKKKLEDIEKKKKAEEAKKKLEEDKEKKKQEDLEKKTKAEEEKKQKGVKKPEENKKKQMELKKKEESKSKIGVSMTPKNSSSATSKKDSSVISTPKPEESVISFPKPEESVISTVKPEDSLSLEVVSEPKQETPPSELKCEEPAKPEQEEEKLQKISNPSLPSLEEIQIQIKSMKSSYQEDEISTEKPFELSVGAKSALSLLTTMDEDKFYLDRVPKEEVIWTFRLFFILLDKVLPANDEEAWTECQKFLANARDKEKNHKTIDKFIIETINGFNFSDSNIDKIEEMVYGKDQLLQPQYYTEFCALTGLLMFAVREAAIFGGAIKGKVPVWRQYKRLVYKQQQLENNLLS